MTALLQINGETLLYPIVGHPIGQVKSPGHLSEIMARAGINGMVVPAHVRPERIADWLESLAGWENIPGLVLTVPHKQAGLAFCDRVSARARAANAVNIMVRAGKEWVGDATDGAGHLEGLARAGFEIAGKTALLVGTGGAGAAIAWEILARGAASLALHDIDETRRDALLARLAQDFPGRARPGSPDPTGFDLVANATPLGMHEGDPLPFDVTRLAPWQFVSDVVTRPAVPPLIAAARARGCATMPGSAMFEAQAQLLADILTGRVAIEA